MSHANWRRLFPAVAHPRVKDGGFCGRAVLLWTGENLV
jgi:hypothetical protein